MAPLTLAAVEGGPVPPAPPRHRYLIGLGSNLEPAANLALARRSLAAIGQRFVFSTEAITEPVGMVSEHLFHNQVAYMESGLDPVALKCCFNAVETAMGRDRGDALCKVKDRPIDLDIISELDPAANFALLLADPLIREAPDYNRSLLYELVGLLQAEGLPPLDGSAVAH